MQILSDRDGISKRLNASRRCVCVRRQKRKDCRREERTVPSFVREAHGASRDATRQAAKKSIREKRTRTKPCRGGWKANARRFRRSSRLPQEFLRWNANHSYYTQRASRWKRASETSDALLPPVISLCVLLCLCNAQYLNKIAVQSTVRPIWIMSTRAIIHSIDGLNSYGLIAGEIAWLDIVI